MEECCYAIYYAENDKDIIFAEFTNNLKVDLAVAEKIVISRLDLMKDRKHFVIIDVSNVREMTAEAKRFLQGDTGLKNILGAAFIASNPIGVLFANIFIKTPKNFEARFFSKKEDALIWIMDYKKKSSARFPAKDK